MRLIDQKLMDELSAQAKANPRLRQHYDLRDSADANSQQMLNAMEPGTVIPVHRHMKSSESIVMLRGKLLMRLYEGDGSISDEFIMEPCGERPLVQVDLGQWHSLEVLEEGTIALMAQDGKYEEMRGEDMIH